VAGEPPGAGEEEKEAGEEVGIVKKGRRKRSKTFEIGGAQVVLYPNGEEEIWVIPPANISWVDAGKYGIKLRPRGLGKVGFGLEIARMAFRRPITTVGVGEDGNPYPPKGEVAPDLWHLELVQYDTTPEASEFRAWYEGRGPYPRSNQEEK
jgi:hypothetical protein